MRQSEKDRNHVQCSDNETTFQLVRIVQVAAIRRNVICTFEIIKLLFQKN